MEQRLDFGLVEEADVRIAGDGVGSVDALAWVHSRPGTDGVFKDAAELAQTVIDGLGS